MQDLIYRSLIEVVQAGRNRVSESLVVCVGMYKFVWKFIFPTVRVYDVYSS